MTSFAFLEEIDLRPTASWLASGGLEAAGAGIILAARHLVGGVGRTRGGNGVWKILKRFSRGLTAWGRGEFTVWVRVGLLVMFDGHLKGGV